VKKHCFKVIALAVFVVMVFAGISSAFPTGPIRFIVPFPPGGGSDMLARTLAPHLARELGVPVVVENLEGAGTQIGLTALLNAPADGYTITQASQPHMAFTIAAQGASYEGTDFAWLNMQHLDPVSFTVMPGKPWQNFQDLFDYIKANPGQVAIATTQMSGTHVLLYYLQEEYDLDFIIVPYPGGGEGRAALLGGHVDVNLAHAFSDFSLRDQLRNIGVGSDERSSLWPDTATILEATGDGRLNEVAKAAGMSFRGVAVSRQFKENHPERFQILVEAYYRAYHSAEHMADSERTGQTPIMHWTGPEEAERLAAGANQIIAAFAHYFAR
jgi:tripartite-type tricarboxylate transporter receptor subunit TctC